MEKYGFVYIWYDKKRKMYYVGCHWGTESDGYICSSNRMRDAYRRRPNDFKRRIVEKTGDKSFLFDIEYKWLSKINESDLGKKYYNLRKHKWNHWSSNEKDSRSIKQKVSDTKKKYWSSSESDNNRKLLSELNKSKGIKPPSRAGKIPWNKGLTKDTDPRVQANAVAVSKPKSNTEKMGKYDRSNPNYNIKNGKK
jgi:hypothetical protein